MRLTGGAGYDVKLVDLSEGGALIEVDAPLRPGVTLTLELSGPGIETAIPIEVLRCYIANLRGETRDLSRCVRVSAPHRNPERSVRRALPAPAAADFVGTEAALKYLLDRCPPSGPRSGGQFTATTVVSGSGRTSDDKTQALDRIDVLRILDALRVRTSGAGSDVLSRHTSDLLGRCYPGWWLARLGTASYRARRAASRIAEVFAVHAAADAGRLILLVDYCARTAAEERHRTAAVEEPRRT